MFVYRRAVRKFRVSERRGEIKDLAIHFPFSSGRSLPMVQRKIKDQIRVLQRVILRFRSVFLFIFNIYSDFIVKKSYSLILGMKR